jgi:hypothetical protein
VQDVAGPPVAQPGDVGQLVIQAGRDHQSPCRDAQPVVEEGPEPAGAVEQQGGDDAVDDVAAVAADLVAARNQQLGGGHAVAGEVAVHMGGRAVAWRARVDHDDLAAGSGKHQCCRQACRAPTDDRDVVLSHAPKVEARGRFAYECCCLWESGVR